jgi:GAF domain-containing protein
VVEAKVQGAGDEDMDDLALEGTKTGLLEAFANTVRGASSESFLVKAEQTFRASVEQSDRVDALQALLSELGRCVPGLAAHDPQATIRGADALNQARVLANEVALWSEHRKIVEADERAAAIRQFGQRLAALYDEQRLNEILVSEMPALDIPGFYLVRYEPQQRSDLWAQIMAAYTGKGRIDPALSGRHFRADRLLPSGALVQPECQNLLVQMIEFQNTRIGYAVFELGPLDGELYTSLSEQLGAAMWGLRLTESERRRTLQLQTAAELGQVATLLLDPDDLMQRAVDLALQRLDLYYAGVFLVDDEGKWTGEPGRWAVLRAGTGQAGREMLARRHKLEIGGSSMIGQCIVQKHERVALEVQRESSRFDNPFLPHTHSELALPLISRGRAIGAMTIQSTLPGDFDRQDIATLQLLADQLANAIQTTRLFAASQKALQHTLMLYETGRTLSTSLDEDSLIRAILDNISRELGCEYAIVSTVDRDAGVISSRHGIWQGEHNVFPEWMIKSTYDLDSTDILADVCRTACTEVISGWDDRFNKEIYEQYDHQRLLRMFVPIQVRDRVLGVIEVAYDRDIKGHIGQDEIELVQALVDQMAVALENARLLTVTRQALQETERLYETNQRIAAANTATEMLAAVVKGCGLPVLTRALLWLADLDDDGSRQAFVPVAEWRVGEGVGMSPGERSIVAQEESLSSPRYVTDVKREKAISDEIHSVIEARQIVSLALLPIANGQRQIGLLMLAGDGRHVYSESEKRSLASLVDQLAVGLDRIDLTHQVQNSLRREQALREMTQRVRSAVDVQDVMRVAVQETGRLLGRTAFIHLGDPAAFDWIAGDEQHGS